MLITIFTVYCLLFAGMSLVWLFYVWLRNPAIVDVCWSLGLMLAGLYYLWHGDFSARNMLVAILLIIWALRLAIYLWWTRVRKGHIDKRYTELAQSWKLARPLGYFLNYQLQAALIWLISLLFMQIAHVRTLPLDALDGFAAAVTLLGILGESLADWQLQQSRKQPGSVCQLGLWAHSRHPNYFFDWVCWCGFALFCLHTVSGLLGLASPLILYIIFTRVTGPLTEAGSLRSRGAAYVAYQRITPFFFPTLRRKID